MIEPTETESKPTLDAFVAAMRAIAQEARSDPELVKSAPHDTPVRRLDEVKAARELVLSDRADAPDDPDPRQRARHDRPLNDPPLSSRRFTRMHVRLGARMVPFAGYDMPVQYPTGIIREHLHTRAGAGLFDVSHMGQIALRARSGRFEDAARALETPGAGRLSACPTDGSVTRCSPTTRRRA